MNLILLDSSKKEPLYMQLYKYIKTEIEQNGLHEGDKLPSIRELSNSISVSKITVEKAYLQLVSEGYIESHDRSRYVVSSLEGGMLKIVNPLNSTGYSCANLMEEKSIRYDFTSGGMDMDGFDFSLWKRYLNKVLRNKERLMGYGNIKGEEELRFEITKYIQSSRGVAAPMEQVIIGPGVQSLLNTLCSMLKTQQRSIAFEDPGFRNGRRIFADHGFTIKPIIMEADGIAMEDLLRSDAKLVYVSPSHQFPTGYTMSIGRRYRLLQWAEETNGLIIEDDYDSEFRYFGRPIPALKGLDGGGNVVYLGSFSKVMPPSLRISYMVLPAKLMDAFHQNRDLYNQAASTIEQLALAQFMADGHLERQIRRLRKMYYDKRLLFFRTIREVLGEAVKVDESEAGLHTVITVDSTLSTKELVQRALAQGCLIRSLEDYYYAYPAAQQRQMLLYFSRVPSKEIERAIWLLKKAWFG